MNQRTIREARSGSAFPGALGVARRHRLFTPNWSTRKAVPLGLIARCSGADRTKLEVPCSAFGALALHSFGVRIALRPNRFIERTANGGLQLSAPLSPAAPLSAAHVER